MKTIFFLAGLQFVLSCQPYKQSGGSQVPISDHEQYRLKHSVFFTKNYNAVVVSQPSEFAELFYLNNTPTAKAKLPDFDNEMVLSVSINPVLSHNELIKFEKFELSGNAMKVYCATSQMNKYTKLEQTSCGNGTKIRPMLLL